ncbi:MAG: glycerol-3-phosphate 1-O-acyltransferase PlsY [Lachnospiraceae bacterium]|nr:glycerol-3-phosphate 1-O-acyltransferase PlsY [Lachnospiraceae bacterium]
MIILNRLICLVVGYSFGLIQAAYIIGKLNNIDIREYGSGNSGTTNAMRVLGKKMGTVTFLVDGFKAIIAMSIIRCIFNDCDYMFVLILYTGLGVVLGHNFPFYMNFKGGKGIAASAGVILATFDLKLLILAIITFGSVALISRYVSLGSLCVLTGFFVELIIFSELKMMGRWSGYNYNYKLECYLIVFILAVLAFVRHSANIKRLMNGTERKIGSSKNK